MAELKQEADPEEVGLDSDRLARIDRHFARYVDDGRLAGCLIAIARHGRLAHVSTIGMRDLEHSLPVETETIWRLYSMTKPITSVAAMMLAEEGAFELADPVSRFIPSFADVRVYTGGPALRPLTAPATQPMRIWHLLTHTSGLTYGFFYANPVDAMYRAAGFELSGPTGVDLAECCERWAALPLLFEPGTEWNYSHATDVVGRIVEIVSGQSLDEFFRTRIFEPLGMTDTAFEVPQEKLARKAVLYMADPSGTGTVVSPQDAPRPYGWLAGGAGLTGTAYDYHRFASMLRGKGELDGVRLLGPRTVDYMATNHLPGGVDLQTFGRAPNPDRPSYGLGFGLGFSVNDNPAAAKIPSSVGEFGWSGAATTQFWVDPTEDMTVLFFTQLVASPHPVRSQLQALVNQAVVGE